MVLPIKESFLFQRTIRFLTIQGAKIAEKEILSEFLRGEF